MTETSDILVIGAGIAGASAAAWLSPDAAVTVLEMEDAPGRHSTGRSAAIYIRNYGGPVLRALNDLAAPAFADPGDLTDGPVLKPRGQLMVATADEIDAFDAYMDGAAGLDRLSPAEARALFPLLREGYAVAAAYERDAQDIDVDRLLQGCLRTLRRNGGKVATGARAGTIARKGGVWRVETPAGAFEAPVLVDAAGAWADEVAKLAGVRPLGLTPKRRSAAILPAPEGVDVTAWPLIASVSMRWYAKPDAGKFMVSPADEDPMEPHDAWPDDMVLAEGIDRFAQAMDYEVTRVERSWAGLRTFAADGDPVAGFDPEAEGFFWLAGQGGHGVQTSPAMAALAADLILGRTPALPADAAAALAPGRPALAAARP